MKTEIIKKCHRFAVCNNTIYTINSEKYFLINNKLINKGCFSISGFFDNNIVLFEENKFESSIYSKKGELIKHIEDFAIIVRERISPTVFFVGINDGNTIYYAKFCVVEFKVLEKFSSIRRVGTVFKNDTFISNDTEKIGCLDFENKEVWYHTFSSLLGEEVAGISNEIIEISGIIYFILFGKETKKCFGLDANTGKVVKNYPDLVGQLVVEDEYIYFLHTEIISVLNTKTDEITTWFIDDLMKEKGIDSLLFPRWAVRDGLIYFSQSKGADRYSDNVGARFGVLDPIKKEMLWHHQLPLENGIIGEIKVNQNRIYLHTQDQTLFVFEKEE
ncbi:hypothetical protein FNW52_15860 [Flavobacterium sp. ZT3R18]|uniref:hypothetical protein n=1 Tax=Flavobacterium sp. ZT3R18 TaxID=2594429 RepID=UPI001179F16C|nr:hypothetical protein [Flavobacterium sp. ZT3R18]TRX33233.1 hypothetical protein FNW52_15860 [Flavobacterium sp. ZT3R18]